MKEEYVKPVIKVFQLPQKVHLLAGSDPDFVRGGREASDIGYGGEDYDLDPE